VHCLSILRLANAVVLLPLYYCCYYFFIKIVVAAVIYLNKKSVLNCKVKMTFSVADLLYARSNMSNEYYYVSCEFTTRYNAQNLNNSLKKWSTECIQIANKNDCG